MALKLADGHTHDELLRTVIFLLRRRGLAALSEQRPELSAEFFHIATKFLVCLAVQDSRHFPLMLEQHRNDGQDDEDAKQDGRNEDWLQSIQ